MKVIQTRLGGLVLLAAAATVSAEHDTTMEPLGPAYYPPFARGQSVLISQAFGGPNPRFGSITHNDPINYYAVDFVLKEGDWVCAARAGRVMQVYDGQRWFSRDEVNSNHVYLTDRFNNIQVYEHLKPGSIRVRFGDQVQRGECFAQAGKTGTATGAHLHFAILHQEANGQYRSIPFQLIGVDELPYTPQQLDWVRH